MATGNIQTSVNMLQILSTHRIDKTKTLCGFYACCIFFKRRVSSATFATKEEAIKEYENWIDDLELQTQEIVQVVKPVWKEYCKVNKILIKESDCEIK